MSAPACSNPVVISSSWILPPHQLETLREDHYHRRLGFSDEEMRSWIEAAGLKLGQQVALHPEEPGGQLTMKIWVAAKPA